MHDDYYDPIKYQEQPTVHYFECYTFPVGMPEGSVTLWGWGEMGPVWRIVL